MKTKMNRFKVDRKIQKLADHIYTYNSIAEIVTDQHRKDSVKTRDRLEEYIYFNDKLLNRILNLVEEMVKIEKANQEIIIDLKNRIDVLEKK